MTQTILLDSWLEDFRTKRASGLSLLTGANGSGKSQALREFSSSLGGSILVSPETQQQFYEQDLLLDEANFNQGQSTSRLVSSLLGEEAREHPLFHAWKLEPLLTRRYRQLSTGESRKVLLLSSVLKKPRFLLLDEPFEGLDARSREELWSGLLKLSQELPLLVASTLSEDDAPHLLAAQEILVVQAGTLIFRGDAQGYAARKLARPAHLKAVPLPDRPPEHAGSEEPLIILSQGVIRYGDHTVFQGLDWILRPGEHTLISGPNGSGKSSLLQMIAGDHPQAYQNQLTLFGRRRGTGESVWDIKQKLGLVSGQLHREYRVGGSLVDVVLSGFYDSIGLYQQPTPSEIERAHAWLDWLDLGVPESTRFRDLSPGLQRLVLIARAAVKIPPLLILDEPTAGLDPDNRERILDLVESLCTQELTTVLFVSHREDERRFWSERIRGAHLSLSDFSGTLNRDSSSEP